jgi:hypothetical protein
VAAGVTPADGGGGGGPGMGPVGKGLAPPLAVA